MDAVPYVAGVAVLTAKFLLTPFGLPGITSFSLFLGLKMVGDETGDLVLSFLVVTKTEGLSTLIFFKLAGSFSLSDLCEVLILTSIFDSFALIAYLIYLISLGSDFSDFTIEPVNLLLPSAYGCFFVSLLDFSLDFFERTLFLSTTTTFLEFYYAFLVPSLLLMDAPDFFNFELSFGSFFSDCLIVYSSFLTIGEAYTILDY